MKRYIPVLIAAFVASLFIACGEETVKPLEKVTLKTKGEIMFNAFKDQKEENDATTGDPAQPCKDGTVDSNGDGVVEPCEDGGSYPGDPGQPGDGGYGAMPLCPEIIGLDFSTCPAEKGRPVFIIDFGRSCVLGMKCDYQTDPNDPGQACPMIWAPVCGVDGRTYDNDCFAKMFGMEIAYPGECQGDPADPNGCKDVYPAEPVSCPDGTYAMPIYDEMGCMIGFECGYSECPDIEKPVYNKCPDTEMYPIYDYNGCIVGWDCVPPVPGDDCAIGMPNPEGYCADGQKMEPVYDERGCVIDWYCVGDGTTTDPSDPTTTP